MNEDKQDLLESIMQDLEQAQVYIGYVVDSIKKLEEMKGEDEA